MIRKLANTAFITYALVLSSTIVQAQSFSGDFEFAWLDTPDGDHRDMRVLRTIKFTDTSGKIWTVPANSIVNGASIPRILWTFAGSPYVGKYRRASVVHDHYCDIRTELQSNVHLMFKEAMLADGASWWEANSKYGAVVFAGLCPEKEGIATSKLETFFKNNPERLNQKTINQLSLPKAAAETSAQKFSRDKEEVRSTLMPDEQLVFDRLLGLKAAETQTSLAALENALQENRIEDQRYEELVILADAIYPEDFK